MERLGLGVEDASTQIVPRDRHAELLSAIALAGAGLERFATEVRNLQRTEVREVEEPFGKGQKGMCPVCGGCKRSGCRTSSCWPNRKLRSASPVRLLWSVLMGCSYGGVLVEIASIGSAHDGRPGESAQVWEESW